MTVLEKKAASGVETKGLDDSRLGRYIAVGIAAVAIGIGAGFGAASLGESDELTPSQIAEIRAGDMASQARAQWLAEVEATRASDLVEFHQRRYQASVAEINDQRAQAMVELRYGWEGEPGS